MGRRKPRTHQFATALRAPYGKSELKQFRYRLQSTTASRPP